MDSKLTGVVAVKAVEVSLYVVGAIACAVGGYFGGRLLAKYKKGDVLRVWRKITPAKAKVEPVVKETVVAEVV